MSREICICLILFPFLISNAGVEFFVSFLKLKLPDCTMIIAAFCNFFKWDKDGNNIKAVPD